MATALYEEEAQALGEKQAEVEKIEITPKSEPSQNEDKPVIVVDDSAAAIKMATALYEEEARALAWREASRRGTSGHRFFSWLGSCQ